MKKIVVSIIALILIISMINVPISKADVGATVGSDKTTVKPGETFDVFVTLSSESIGYDITYSTTEGASAISKQEVISTIANNSVSGNNRIYLVQPTGEANRVVHNSGTKIACIRYTVASTATAGTKITINANGDIVGKLSEQNSVSGSKTVTVDAASTPSSSASNNESSTTPSSSTSVSTASNSSTSTSVVTTTSNQSEKKEAIPLPKTGVVEDTIYIAGIGTLITIAIISAKKIRDLKY